jgi:hypothetical protein
MKAKKSLFFYILLNILISAASTLIVLLIWQAAHPAPEIASPNALSDVPSSASSTAPGGEAASAQSTPEFVQENVQVLIRSVVGAGNLEMEYVQIFNQSEGAVNLNGWQLQNGRGQHFTFPALILNQEGAVEVHSKAGTSTVIELYWQSDAPIWQSGDTVALVDVDGTIQATYQIP